MKEKMNILRNLYLTGVHAVQPQNLMPKWLVRHGEKLKIGGIEYALKDTYIVGFGKAVGGMIPHIENVLQTSGKSYIKEGIVSVPVGYLETAALQDFIITTHPKIRLYEGAKSNLPDLAAQSTAEKIAELVKTLSEKDLLIVLISGGGSALFPLPLAPLSLSEKTQIIKTLSLAGASIYEINTVRRAISALKGGKLARSTKADIVSFILSDTMDNSLDVIASGPTVPNTDSLDAPLKVLQKYDIPLTDNLKKVLYNRSKQEDSVPHFKNVNNIIIGDNKYALRCIYDDIKNKKELQWTPIILTSCLQGEARTVGKAMAQFAFAVLDFLCGKTFNPAPESFSKILCINPSIIYETESLIKRVKSDLPSQSLCLLFGGETTVEVKGKGTGGRNQEMVLWASLEMERLSKLKDANGEIILLSGGTDGIDGPTDAAGAITFFSRNKREETRLQTCESREQGLSPEGYLEDNNSYEYFTKLSNGIYLLKPGHTGTNVMDVQLLLIKKCV